MRAMRCKECGDVRWSLTGRHTDHSQDRCELCGGEMVPERRVPGHRRPGGETAERRDVAPPPAA